MPLIIQYLLKLSISLSVVYSFYVLFLRRLTFHNWNRWYLLGYSIIAFLIPFINITPILEQHDLGGNKVLQIIPLVDYYTVSKLPNSLQPIYSWNRWEWMLVAALAGAGIMLIRLAIQYFSFYRIRSKATLLFNHSVKVYQVERSIIPFSFGNAIFINQHLHEEEELKEIIRHEFIHIKQKHTLDIVWAECLCVLNWYNPFAWMIRKAIRQNLEFITDHKVLENGIDKKQYQYLLLKVIGVSQFSIAPQFNFSSLKKRIAMMNKLRSARMHLLKFPFIFPLLLVMLLAFRKQQQSNFTPLREELPQDTIPLERGKLPKEFKHIYIDNDMVTIKLQDGKTEKYSLKSEEDKNAFEKKYGRTLESILPPPPPPPPPPPMLEGVSHINVKDKVIILKLKNGETEKYDLNREEDKKAFEKKYGKKPEEVLPPAPPPRPSKAKEVTLSIPSTLSDPSEVTVKVVEVNPSTSIKVDEKEVTVNPSASIKVDVKEVTVKPSTATKVDVKEVTVKPSTTTKVDVKEVTVKPSTSIKVKVKEVSVNSPAGVKPANPSAPVKNINNDQQIKEQSYRDNINLETRY